MSEINELKKLRNVIELLENIHQLHILKILNENHVEYTENANGIFINMSMLDKGTVAQIKTFIKYVNLQQKQLETVEDIKAQYQEEFYKDNKENAFC